MTGPVPSVCSQCPRFLRGSFCFTSRALLFAFSGLFPLSGHTLSSPSLAPGQCLPSLELFSGHLVSDRLCLTISSEIAWLSSLCLFPLCISCLHSSSLYLKLYSMLVCSEVLRRPASFVLLTERFPVPEAVPGTW